MIDDFLRFQPLYKTRVWGGQALAATLGRALPPDVPIGESWEIVDRPEACSQIVGGAWGRLTLHEAIARHPAEIMGPRWPAERPFPILVKWLDCRERLSLQVHPPAQIAAELGGEPKTENWYIAATAPGASLLAGLRPGITLSGEFERALVEQTLEDCVALFPVAAGDSLFVRSGQIHAIDAGNFILEIQQNSDTTYRVYDWGRIGLDGKPRQLHVAESLRSILWDDNRLALVKAARQPAVLAQAPEFRIRRVPLAAGATLEFAAGEEPRILSLVEGRLRLKGGAEIAVGENVILPFAAAPRFTAAVDSMALITEGFGTRIAGHPSSNN